MIPLPKPITEAYEQTAALSVSCPSCHAPVGRYCTDPATGRLRRIPCVTRCGRPCRDNTVGVGSTDGHPGPSPAEAISAPSATGVADHLAQHPELPHYFDPSEPRRPHNREDD